MQIEDYYNFLISYAGMLAIRLAADKSQSAVSCHRVYIALEGHVSHLHDPCELSCQFIVVGETMIRVPGRRLRCIAMTTFRVTTIVGVIVVGSTLCRYANAQQQGKWPPVTDFGSRSELGHGIQRTMTLLETSTPEKRNTVKILLYGQSITAGHWGQLLETDLRRRFPHANLIFERRPLSGFSTERLVRTSEADLYPFYADLVIFHDYGNNEDYETMVRKLREQTTAEVIIQGDHIRRSEQVMDESRPADIEERRQRWAAMRNYEFLPQIAQKYGCAFDARRNPWKAYLREYNLEPGALVRDDVHPNEHGTYVMTELIKAYMVRRNDVEIDPMNCGYVTTVSVDAAQKIGTNRVKLEFDGNRFDVVLRSDVSATCSVTIDGHAPLADSSMFYHGRNRVKWRDTPIPPGPWPAILKMGFVKPLIKERWTLRATQDPTTPEVYSFSLIGTETGEDGSGRTDERFVSKSGRVVIESEDWDVPFSIVALRRLEHLPKEFQLDWEVETQAVNNVVAPDPHSGIERVVTVAQRIQDSRHTVELAGDISAIEAFRVYSPSKFPCPANAE